MIRIEHSIVKNWQFPNWPEGNPDQLAIYICGRRFEHGITMKQIQTVDHWITNPRGALTTRSCYFLHETFNVISLLD